MLPRAREVLRHCGRRGRVVILSDGDAVFQPHKIARSGLAKAARGDVLIFVHKERELRTIRRTYPGRHYVVIDDKPQLLAKIKAQWKDGVTTVFVRQGHYAYDRKLQKFVRRADHVVNRIADVMKLDFRRST